MIGKFKRQAFFLGSLFIFFTVLIFLGELENKTEANTNSQYQIIPEVTIADISTSDHKSEIRVYGEVTPRWSVVLKSQVSGEITNITRSAFEGMRVAKGDSLMTIESSRYQSALADAQFSLAQAQLNLLQAQQKTELAKQDWKLSGLLSKPSELALFQPQLALAITSVNAAKQRLQTAQTNLSYTNIKASFAGVVTARNVGLSQLVSEGDALITLIDHKNLELMISLNHQQWQKLSASWRGAIVTLSNTSNIEIGKALIKRGGAVLDSDTRQYSLFLEVIQDGSNKTLPGEFVSVVLPGKTYSNSLRIPESALTREGLVWYLDEGDHLRSFFVKSPLSYDDQLIVSPPSNLPYDSSTENGSTGKKNWRIATVPLAFFMHGKNVMPIIEREE